MNLCEYLLLRTTAFAEKSYNLYRKAIYNEFLLSQDVTLTTTSVSRKINAFAPTSEDGRVALMDYICDLFDRIVYKPAYGHGVNLQNYENYAYGSDNVNWEQFLHDLIHESLDPNISGTFSDDDSDAPADNFPAENFYAEHAAQFVGDARSTKWLEYGIDRYIKEILYIHIFDYLNMTDEITLSDLKSSVMNKLREDGESMKSSYAALHKVVMDECRKLFYQEETSRAPDTDDEQATYKFLDTFYAKLSKSVKQRFAAATKKNLPNNMIDDAGVATANRVNMFLHVLDSRIDDGTIPKLVSAAEESEEEE